jgi:hypothetical protein
MAGPAPAILVFRAWTSRQEAKSGRNFAGFFWSRRTGARAMRRGFAGLAAASDASGSARLGNRLGDRLGASASTVASVASVDALAFRHASWLPSPRHPHPARWPGRHPLPLCPFRRASRWASPLHLRPEQTLLAARRGSSRSWPSAHAWAPGLLGLGRRFNLGLRRGCHFCGNRGIRFTAGFWARRRSWSQVGSSTQSGPGL